MASNSWIYQYLVLQTNQGDAEFPSRCSFSMVVVDSSGTGASSGRVLRSGNGLGSRRCFTRCPQVSVWQCMVVITLQPSPMSHGGKQSIQEGTHIALHKWMGLDGSHKTSPKLDSHPPQNLPNARESFVGAVTQHSAPLHRDQRQQLVMSDIAFISIQIVQ